MYCIYTGDSDAPMPILVTFAGVNAWALERATRGALEVLARAVTGAPERAATAVDVAAGIIRVQMSPRGLAAIRMLGDESVAAAIDWEFGLKTHVHVVFVKEESASRHWCMGDSWKSWYAAAVGLLVLYKGLLYLRYHV